MNDVFKKYLGRAYNTETIRAWNKISGLITSTVEQGYREGQVFICRLSMDLFYLFTLKLHTNMKIISIKIPSSTIPRLYIEHHNYPVLLIIITHLGIIQKLLS
jgi:hypothetical protein